MKLFDSVMSNAPKRNKFDLSHEKKMSVRMGELIPMLVEEVLPGDKFRVSTETLMRFAPMLAPIMHQVDCYIHYFFVPNRLIWSEWETFITGGPDGTSVPVAPYMNVKETNRALWNVGLLPDYMGVPIIETGDPVVNTALPISALPFRAYQEIYNQYYRDQNTEPTPVTFSKASGLVSDPDTTALTGMRKRSWEKDYFTSALPFAQRGATATVPVTGSVSPGSLQTANVRNTAGGGLNSGTPLNASLGALKSNATDVYMDLTGSGTLNNASMDIQNLRRAYRLQQWLERNAVGGARYIEQILMHFGVKSSDARLQRPEYLGGGKTPIRISEVLSTFQTTAENIPQGNMAGHGIGVGKSNQFEKQFEEHGFVMGIMSLLPRTAYQQGVRRMFSRFDKFDYFWPEFANLGEQGIQKKEIYWKSDVNGTVAAETWGYQSRYAEYKYGVSSVHGVLKTSLKFWHMGRIFTSMPLLNSSFTMADPTTRVFAIPGQEQIYCQLYNKIDAIRPMPYYGTPTL